MFATNTLIDVAKPTGTFKAGQRTVFEVRLPLFLNDGGILCEAGRVKPGYHHGL